MSDIRVISIGFVLLLIAFSALTLLGGRKGIRPVKTERSGAGVVICLERRTDLHMSQLMQLPLTDSCFSKIQIGFTFLVPAHPGSPGQRAVKRVCVCVCGISWTICKQSTPRSRQITTPTPYHSIFYRPDALPDASQQCQSTEGTIGVVLR